MAQPDQPRARGGSLVADLDRLREILSESAEPLAALQQLADPGRLGLLFQVELRRRVKDGPEGELAPADLLPVLAEASEAGLVAFAAPVEARRCLDRAAERVRSAGAWASEAPLWWEPLPAEAGGERARLHRRLVEALPPPESWRAAFSGSHAAAPPSPPKWLALPELLPAEIVRELYGELRGAEEAGALALERAGVGAEDRRTSRRSDSVLYLSGFEPELLAAAPSVAALIQGCLGHLGPRLAESLPGLAAFAPGSAMLARYPAPSAGFHPHLDNPGGDDDNGRVLTLVLYLNPPEAACQGGEITLWGAGGSAGSASGVPLPARGGSAVVFDSWAVAHQVQPLLPGPARWALTVWLNDLPQGPLSPPLPELSTTDVLLPVPSPPLPNETVLAHELDDRTPAGAITVQRVASPLPRAGIVSTVYRGGAALDAWCEHHFALGFEHLVLIFDHLEEPAESADAERLRARYPEDRLSVWSGTRVAAERWPVLEGTEDLERFARSGASSHAVAARQTLGASAALRAAQDDELGVHLDWLFHLDGDELFHLEGSGRGGATLGEHLAAASTAGWCQLRYVNHELLRSEGGVEPRFKLNPRLAAARLGAAGWQALVEHLDVAQSDPRPYFAGYFNGKSAVAVAAGTGAAGVHGWSTSASPETGRFLAGPSVLHFHFTSARAFRRKYLAVADSELPEGPLLFERSPVEVATLERIREWRRAGVDGDELARRLERWHVETTSFSAPEVDLLEAAGLLLRPRLPSTIGDTMSGRSSTNSEESTT